VLALAALGVAVVFSIRGTDRSGIKLPRAADTEPTGASGAVTLESRNGPDRHEEGSTKVSTDVTITVRSSAELPVSGAAIDLLEARKRTRLAVSDQRGVAIVHRNQLTANSEVIVSASGYATAFVSHPAIVNNSLSVVLETEGTLCGTVLSDGVPISGSGVWVTAVPLPTAYTENPSAIDRARCLQAMSIEVDGSGHFCLRGLRNGQNYCLEALGPSAVGRSGRENAFKATVDGITLQMQDVYGAILAFTCDNKEYLATRFRTPRTEGQYPGELRQFVDWRSSLAISSAIDRQCDEHTYCLPLLYTAIRRVRADLSTTVTLRIPGFHLAHTIIALKRMGSGALPIQDVKLEPSAPDAGTVAIDLVGRGAGCAIPNGVRGHLHLQPQSQGAAETDDLSFPVQWVPGTNSTRIDGVPAGVYQWKLSIEAGWITIEPQADEKVSLGGALRVEKDTTVELEASLPACGYVRVECFDRSAPLYGVVSIASGSIYSAPHGRAKWVRSIAYRGAPSLLGPLPPGTYDMRLEPPLSTPEGAHRCEVRDGEVTTEVFVVP
jgi:hypothetical protein